MHLLTLFPLLSLLAHATAIRYEAFLEAEPIHPTFEEGDVRLERLEDDTETVTTSAYGCDDVMQLKLADFGTITSPNYPRRYPNRQMCEWILESENGTRIEATVFDLFTQPWFFAYFDYVLISRDGDFRDAERLFGDLNSKTPMTIRSTKNRLGIRFRSSTYFNFRGFKLQYLVVPDGNQTFGEPIHLDGICGRSFLLNSDTSTTQITEVSTASSSAIEESTGGIPDSDIFLPTTDSSTIDESTGGIPDSDIFLSTTEGSRWKSNSKYFEHVHGKIVGGAPPPPFGYPWMAALLIDGRSFCGGSLIDNQHVLTAAHCTDGAKKISILLGSHNLKAPKATEPSRMVVNVTRSAIFQHPDYNRRTISNDVSILRLPNPINFTKEIQPVCLPNKYFLSETFENSHVRVAGWGKTKDNGGSISEQLQHTGISVMSNSECKKSFRGIITGNVICVETKQRQSPCKGDSGGPLMIIQSGPQGDFFMQLGVVSFGSSQCERGNPVGFTRITAYLDFIAKVTDRKV